MKNNAHDEGLVLKGVVKRYGGNAPALQGIDLTVAPGEFMTLLGPSGSGKSTTLNLIAGFLRPDEGQILMNGRPITDTPAYKRNIGIVFQNYALFPHMTAAANIAFPLKQKRWSKADITRAVGRALEMVGLEEYGARYPRELSGGQQQRVALARALVFEPEVLLLDEPLGSLDRRLREGLQLEIKRIHEEVGMTFLFVTHDQDEALVMSDRIAVFNHGRIEQVDTTVSLYENPRSQFVAEFLGDSNVLHGRLAGVAGEERFLGEGLDLAAPTRDDPTRELADGVALIVRPEKLRVLRRERSGGLLDRDELVGRANVVSGTVANAIYMGGHHRLRVRVNDSLFIVDTTPESCDEPAAGDEVVLSWWADDAVLVPSEQPPTSTTTQPR
jgi:putative spermidine/putrescine transport system ATP-binding protein